MKALTLTQPWATLMAIGAKKIETRSWSTRYRGDLAIHAAKGFPRWAKNLCFTDPFFSAIPRERDGSSFPTLPLGKVVCVVDLIDVVSTESLVRELWGTNELCFGDYSKRRYAWITEFKRCVEPASPARGALGLWEWAA